MSEAASRLGMLSAVEAESLSPLIKRVARFVDENRALVLASSAAELAKRLGVSDASVIRSVKALGFEGLPDLKRSLAAALDNRSSAAEDMRRTLQASGEDAAQAIQMVLQTHSEAMALLDSEAGRAAIAEAVAVLGPASRIGVFGIGPSAHVARYVTTLLRRAGRASFALDVTGWNLADEMLDLVSGDALLLLAYGRPYPEVQAVAAEGRRLGLALVLVTDDPSGAIARQVDVVLLARRGRAKQVALHAVTVAALEAVAMGLAATDSRRAVNALDRLTDLRRLIGEPKIPRRR